MATSSTGAEPTREIKHTFRRSALFSSGRRTHADVNQEDIKTKVASQGSQDFSSGPCQLAARISFWRQAVWGGGGWVRSWEDNTFALPFMSEPKVEGVLEVAEA